MPKVSVVMPSYNHANFISEAIESVLNQTFQDFELIIVDDCSTDVSAEIIKAYLKIDERIRAIFHQTNMGIARTTNDGLKATRGDYIALAASDDIFEREKLAVQIAILDREQAIGVVHTDAEIIDEKGNFTNKFFSVEKRMPKELDDRYFQALLQRNFITSPVVRKQSIGSTTYNEQLKYLNDWLFWLDLSLKTKFRFVNHALYRYRAQTDKAKIRNYHSDKVMLTEIVLKRYNSLIPRKLKAQMYSYLAKAHLEKDELCESRGYTRKSVIYNPLAIREVIRLLLLYSCRDVETVRNMNSTCKRAMSRIRRMITCLLAQAA